ncbi:MAG: transcription elongation factor [Psychromonas sp.]|uniref:hypothetical protein n=1 Tax=Psychromonas sp. TaxID=1884585 RepID=UPI0039E6F54E
MSNDGDHLCADIDDCRQLLFKKKSDFLSVCSFAKQVDLILINPILRNKETFLARSLISTGLLNSLGTHNNLKVSNDGDHLCADIDDCRQLLFKKKSDFLSVCSFAKQVDLILINPILRNKETFLARSLISTGLLNSLGTHNNLKVSNDGDHLCADIDDCRYLSLREKVILFLFARLLSKLILF